MDDELPLELKVIEEFLNSDLLTLEMLEALESRIHEHKTQAIESNAIEDKAQYLLDMVHRLQEQLRWTKWHHTVHETNKNERRFDPVAIGAPQ